MSEFYINNHIIKCLTIKQPYASLIIDGKKDIENRTWKKHMYDDVCDNWLFVHAGKLNETQKNLDNQKLEIKKILTTIDLEKLPNSAILGMIHIKKIIHCDTSTSLWSIGPNCWVIDAVVKFKNPVFTNGKLSLWNPEKSLHQKLHKEIKKFNIKIFN